MIQHNTESSEYLVSALFFLRKDKMTSTPLSEEIINQALCTYVAKGTRYITSAQISSEEDSGINLSCTLSIKESCYLSPGSGHFNAVEAIMCFNQMLYVALLGGIEKKIFPFYKHITPEEFNKNRRKVLILEFEKIKFREQIDNHNFVGKINLKPLHVIKDKIYTDCHFSFGNNQKQSFHGNIKVFIPVL